MADTRMATADLSTLDRVVLESLIAAQQQAMLAKDEALAAQQEKLLSRDHEIEHLKLVIAKLRRMIFGTRSEKVSREIEQLELKLEELETQQAERVTASPQTSAQPKAKPIRRPLPEHLPREVHTHLPAEDACPDCAAPAAHAPNLRAQPRAARPNHRALRPWRRGVRFDEKVRQQPVQGFGRVSDLVIAGGLTGLQIKDLNDWGYWFVLQFCPGFSPSNPHCLPLRYRACLQQGP